jgi:hypothetical protein
MPFQYYSHYMLSLHVRCRYGGIAIGSKDNVLAIDTDRLEAGINSIVKSINNVGSLKNVHQLSIENSTLFTREIATVR